MKKSFWIFQNGVFLLLAVLKVLNSSEVTWLSKSHHSPKVHSHVKKLLKKVIASFTTLFLHLQSQIWLIVHSPQSMLKFPWKLWVLFILKQNVDFSRGFEDLFWREESTNFCSINGDRSVMYGATTFFGSSYLNNRFLRNSGLFSVMYRVSQKDRYDQNRPFLQ